MHTAIKGEMTAPYRYRILKPALSEACNVVLMPIVQDETERYKLIFKSILIVLFFFLYYVFYLFLLNFYSELVSIVGLLLLQITIPLTITDNCWEEGDVINLFLYILAFYSFYKNKDFLVPIIVTIGAFNREQSIYILVFYIAYLWEQKKLLSLKSFVIILSSVFAFGAVYFGIRWFFGYVPNTFTNPAVINIIHWQSGVRLWIEQVLIFIILSILVYKRSRPFFKFSLLGLIPYTILFFFMGVFGELAKYLPALAVMITVSLQVFGDDILNDFNRMREI